MAPLCVKWVHFPYRRPVGLELIIDSYRPAVQPRRKVRAANSEPFLRRDNTPSTPNWGFSEKCDELPIPSKKVC